MYDVSVAMKGGNDVLWVQTCSKKAVNAWVIELCPQPGFIHEGLDTVRRETGWHAKSD